MSCFIINEDPIGIYFNLGTAKINVSTNIIHFKYDYTFSIFVYYTIYWCIPFVAYVSRIYVGYMLIFPGRTCQSTLMTVRHNCTLVAYYDWFSDIMYFPCVCCSLWRAGPSTRIENGTLPAVQVKQGRKVLSIDPMG